MTQPASPGEPLPGPLFLLFIASLTCIEFLQNGMVNFSASYIVGGIGAAPEEFSFAAMAYSVAAILMLFKHRWLAEQLGYRDFALVSLLVYAIGTVVCALSANVPEFVLGRVLQGAGGATFFCAGRVMCNTVAGPGRLRPLLAFVIALLGASTLAPLMAGWLLDHGQWRDLFWSMLPVLALVAVLCWRFMPTEVGSADDKSQAHWGGLIWVVVGGIGLQYALQRSRYDFFSESGRLLALSVAGALCVLWFCRRQMGHARPLIDYRPLFQARFLIGMMCYFFGYLVVNANGFIMPKLAHEGLGFTILNTGGLAALSSIGSLAGALLHVTLLRIKAGFRVYMLSGLVILAGSSALMSRFSPDVTWAWFGVTMLLGGGFMSLFIGPVAQGAFMNMDERTFSHAYQSKNVIRELASSFGITLATLFLQSRGAVHYSRLSENFSLFNPLYRQQVEQLDGILHDPGGQMALGVLARSVDRQSMLMSCLDYYQLLVVMAVIVGLIVYRQRVYN